MKKLLLIASALLAFTFFGCEQPNNPSSPDTGKSDLVTPTPDDSTGGDETTGDDTTGDEETPNDALATTFKFGETYSGKVTYPMIKNSGYPNATASSVMFNIDLSEQSLKAKDVVKLSFKITESSSDAINLFGYQSEIDNWGWHSINVKELGSTYDLSFEVGETTEFEGNSVKIKFVPQDRDGSLIGKDLIIKIEDLSVTLVPYVEETEVVIFEVKSSYQEEAHCKEIGNKTELSEFAGKTVVLTIKYLEGDRNGWGIGEVFFATDNADLYGTKTDDTIPLKGVAATDNICTIECPVDNVIAAMGDAEYISINLWSETELVKISVK